MCAVLLQILLDVRLNTPICSIARWLPSASFSVPRSSSFAARRRPRNPAPTWPGQLDTRKAHALGFPRDENFELVIRQHIRDELGGRDTR